MNTRSESAYEPLTLEESKAVGLAGDGWYRQRSNPVIHYNPAQNRLARVQVGTPAIVVTDWFPDGEPEEWLSRVGG